MAQVGSLPLTHMLTMVGLSEPQRAYFITVQMRDNQGKAAQSPISWHVYLFYIQIIKVFTQQRQEGLFCHHHYSGPGGVTLKIFYYTRYLTESE